MDKNSKVISRLRWKNARFDQPSPEQPVLTLEHHDPFDADPEIPDPFLYGFFAARVKSFQSDLREPSYPAFLNVYSELLTPRNLDWR